MTPETIAARAAAAANDILNDLAADPPRFSARTRAILRSLAARLRTLSRAQSNDLCASKEILYLLGSSASITPDSAADAIFGDLDANPPSLSPTTKGILESIAARLEFLSQSSDERVREVILYVLDSSTDLRPDFDDAIEIEEQERPNDDDGMSGPK